MRRFAVLASAIAFFAAAPAWAKGGPKYPPGGKKCVDSFGAVIDGVFTSKECLKLGARWARPGSKVAQTDKPARRKRHSSGE